MKKKCIHFKDKAHIFKGIVLPAVVCSSYLIGPLVKCSVESGKVWCIFKQRRDVSRFVFI